jgi:uncharacterized protein GlcG (DUF336 family)/rhodanese-related sulfurtransferase
MNRLCVLLLILNSPLVFAQADNWKTPVLTRAQFDQLLAKPEKLVIIDVRRPDELTAIGGFPVYLSIQIAELEKSLAWIPKDRKIVTVSNHAGRAGKAADLLATQGFKVIGRIGAQTYEEAGGKLTKIAQPPPPSAIGPPLELATQAAQIALDVCASKGFNVGVSVIDSGGVLKVLLAKDGVSVRGVQSSTNKAVTSLTFKDATSRLAERVKSDQSLASAIASNPNFNVRAGGVLLKIKDEVIGAIGVGGARGSENDEACALAGIQAIEQRLTAEIARR